MTSRQKLTQAGFTLVELAIVLLIIGLLIAGILKGQQLIENSRMTATIQQTKAYEAAINTFRDSYGALPGDISTASTRVPGCVAGIGCVVPGGNGDGIIGTASTGAGAASGTGVGTEPVQFWLHLALANLITGILPNFQTNNTVAWGTTEPAARLTGGFNVGHGVGVQNGSAGALNGHYIVMQAVPNAAANAATAAALAADKAVQMDLKLDDGLPGTGDAIAFGGATCYTGTGATAAWVTTSTQPVCAIGVRVMN